jgi:hypothetical protein
LYAKCPENPRIKRNAGLRRKRLEQELAKSVERMDFERAAVLRDVAFPGNPELFNVWHDEYQMYHCAGFCGYTRDQSKAGKFTVGELRGWDFNPTRSFRSRRQKRKLREEPTLSRQKMNATTENEQLSISGIPATESEHAEAPHMIAGINALAVKIAYPFMAKDDIPPAKRRTVRLQRF